MVQATLEAGWAVKDILAHISIWEGRMLRCLEEAMRGEVPQMLPPGMTWDDLDLWNEQTFQENKERPLDEVLLEFHSSYQKAISTIESISEEDLINPERFDWFLGGNPSGNSFQPTPIGIMRIIANRSAVGWKQYHRRHGAGYALPLEDICSEACPRHSMTNDIDLSFHLT